MTGYFLYFLDPYKNSHCVHLFFPLVHLGFLLLILWTLVVYPCFISCFFLRVFFFEINSSFFSFYKLFLSVWIWVKELNFPHVLEVYHCVGAFVCRYVCPLTFVEKLGLKWVWVTSPTSVFWQRSPQWEIRLDMEWVEPKSVMSLGSWYLQRLTSPFLWWVGIPKCWDRRVCVGHVSFYAILGSSSGATGARACDQWARVWAGWSQHSTQSSRMLPNLPPLWVLLMPCPWPHSDAGIGWTDSPP